ncbi:hypothetical protein BV898_02892 [Hypsibius exemplaris]|uniref:Uncharacterized protein n=1 Tax=Hypsibius exemplaris TaxID=2072580 RepID=A0A1W0X6Y3_HYPEX|nr:hypothetical protein BV898_02892 [Hypsibius exemplaris]
MVPSPVDTQRHLEENYSWRGAGLAAQRLSLEDPNHLDEHVRATLRRLSRFSGTGSSGLSITPSEVERLQRTYVAAYSTPLGDTIIEESVLDYRAEPDRSISVDALEVPLMSSASSSPRLPSNGDDSYVHLLKTVHPKTFKPAVAPATSLDQLNK